MSVPDYAEMGRELEANRDATLVNAANRGVNCADQLEKCIELLRGCQKTRESLGDRLEDALERAEAAERKLAEFHVLVEALTGLHKRHKNQLCGRHQPLRSPMCSLCQISARIEELEQLNQALAQIEQPTTKEDA